MSTQTCRQIYAQSDGPLTGARHSCGGPCKSTRDASSRASLRSFRVVSPANGNHDVETKSCSPFLIEKVCQTRFLAFGDSRSYSLRLVQCGWRSRRGGHLTLLPLTLSGCQWLGLACQCASGQGWKGTANVSPRLTQDQPRRVLACQCSVGLGFVFVCGAAGPPGRPFKFKLRLQQPSLSSPVGHHASRPCR
jgi:hypothetical protein